MNQSKGRCSPNTILIVTIPATIPATIRLLMLQNTMAATQAKIMMQIMAMETPTWATKRLTTMGAILTWALLALGLMIRNLCPIGKQLVLAYSNSMTIGKAGMRSARKPESRPAMAPIGANARVAGIAGQKCLASGQVLNTRSVKRET